MRISSIVSSVGYPRNLARPSPPVVSSQAYRQLSLLARPLAHPFSLPNHSIKISNTTNILARQSFMFNSSATASTKGFVCSPQKSETDLERSYRVLKLENDLLVLLVSEPGADKAAAAMDVHCGAFDDPMEFQGLAHFCEHMLFLGTEKYPTENSYSSFLAKHGGSSNASTSAENTTYHFDIGKDHLKAALDIFAQFFLSPLFTESCTDREMNAVHSEHSKNLQEDSRRIRQVLRSLAHEKSDWQKFSTGSLETLNKIGIRDKLLEFHSQNYSSNRMRLAILGKENLESLDELEGYARELFSGVKNLQLPQRAPAHIPPYEEAKVGTKVSIVPVKEVRQLRLNFPLPPFQMEHSVKPSRYFSHLLGHEGEGSAFAHLKAKGWASALTAGLATRTFQFEIFEVKVDLTEQGFEHRGEVLDVLMGHLRLVTSTPPASWVFDETKKIEDIRFRFLSKASPRNFVVDRVESLQMYPPELVLKGPFYFGEFDGAMISRYASFLRPDNMMVIEIGKSLLSKCQLTEKIYGAPYETEAIPKSEIERWASITIPNVLSLPVPNEFIPEDLTIKSGGELRVGESRESTFDDIPRLLSSGSGSKLWYLRDRTFLKPKTIAEFRLESPIVSASPGNMTKMQLIERLLEDSLNEYAYYADLAGLHYSISSGTAGIDVTVDGYNDKLGVLLGKVINRLVHLELKSDRLEIHRALLREQLLNFFKDQPYSHAGNFMNEMTVTPMWTVEERLAVLPTIGVDDIRQFLLEVLKQVSVVAFVHGNATEDNAHALLDVVVASLPSSQHALAVSKKRLVQLRKGVSYILENLEPNPQNENSCSHVWWPIGHVNDMKTRAKSWLLFDMLKEPCYQQLRTTEQLGYIVWSGSRSVCNIEGLRVTVQSSVQDPRFLDVRIDSFLQQYQGVLTKMTSDEFEQFKKSRVLKYLEKPNAMAQVNLNYWAEILDLDEPIFNRSKLLADITKTLSHAEIVAHFDAFVLNPSSRRRISSRVFGNKHPRPVSDDSSGVTLRDRTKFLARMPLFPAEYSEEFDSQ